MSYRTFIPLAAAVILAGACVSTDALAYRGGGLRAGGFHAGGFRAGGVRVGGVYRGGAYRNRAGRDNIHTRVCHNSMGLPLPHQWQRHPRLRPRHDARSRRINLPGAVPAGGLAAHDSAWSLPKQ
jgi:hypothetical protein